MVAVVQEGRKNGTKQDGGPKVAEIKACGGRPCSTIDMYFPALDQSAKPRQAASF